MAKSFESNLVILLETHIAHESPLVITWKCVHCGGQHNGNLLKKVKSIALVEGDISLLDGEKKTFALIHISKNKNPKTDLSDSYQQQGIIYIQVNPSGQLELPLFVNTCLNPKCKKCSNFLQDKSMLIINSECWKCNSPMKIAMLDGHCYHPGPEAFTPGELDFARDQGVIIQSNFSSVRRESYLSNTCPACGKLTGEHYLFTGHYSPAICGHYTYTSYPMGYYCEHCIYEQ